VRLEPPLIGAEMDRPELVTRSGANRVHVAAFDRWAAPLDAQVQRVLAEDLAARLPPGALLSAEQPSPSGPYRSLTVSLAEFYGDAACGVTLHADWSLAEPHAAAVRYGVERLQIPGGAPCSGLADLPAPMSRALGMLADRLAQVIRAQ